MVKKNCIFFILKKKRKQSGGNNAKAKSILEKLKNSVKNISFIEATNKKNFEKLDNTLMSFNKENPILTNFIAINKKTYNIYSIKSTDYDSFKKNLPNWGIYAEEKKGEVKNNWLNNEINKIQESKQSRSHSRSHSLSQAEEEKYSHESPILKIKKVFSAEIQKINNVKELESFYNNNKNKTIALDGFKQKIQEKFIKIKIKELMKDEYFTNFIYKKKKKNDVHFIQKKTICKNTECIDTTCIFFNPKFKESWNSKYTKIITDAGKGEGLGLKWDTKSKKIFQNFTEKNNNDTFLATLLIKNKPVALCVTKDKKGWKKMTHKDPKFNLYISRVDVHPDFQGKGLCKPVVSYMIQHLKRLGYRFLFIHNASLTENGRPACFCYYKAGIDNNYKMQYRIMQNGAEDIIDMKEDDCKKGNGLSKNILEYNYSLESTELNKFRKKNKNEINKDCKKFDFNDSEKCIDKIFTTIKEIIKKNSGGGRGGEKKNKENKKKLKKTKKTKIVRKHQGINQSGGKVGKLKKGYKYSGKRLKTGKAEIVKVKIKPIKYKLNLK